MTQTQTKTVERPAALANLDAVIQEITEIDGERSNLHARVAKEGLTRELSRLLTDLQARWDRALQTYAELKS